MGWFGGATAIVMSLAICACAAEEHEPEGIHRVAQAAEVLDTDPEAVLETEDGFLSLRRDDDRVDLLYVARGGQRAEVIAGWRDVEEESETHFQIVVCGPGTGMRRPVYIGGRWEGRDAMRFTGGRALGGRLGEDQFLFALEPQGVPDGPWRILAPDHFLGGEAEMPIVLADSPRSFIQVRNSVPAAGACAVG